MADLRDIDALARLRLGGSEVRVAVPADVRELIRFCGLEEVLSPILAPRVVFRPPHWTRHEDADGRWPR